MFLSCHICFKRIVLLAYFSILKGCFIWVAIHTKYLTTEDPLWNTYISALILMFSSLTISLKRRQFYNFFGRFNQKPGAKFGILQIITFYCWSVLSWSLVQFPHLPVWVTLTRIMALSVHYSRLVSCDILSQVELLWINHGDHL